MPRFLFVYHGGPSSMSKEEGAAHMKRWRAWTKNLGAALVDPGVAVGKSITVSASGIVRNGGASPASGISMVEATDVEAAARMAAVSPHLDVGGSIEIASVLDMSM